MKNPSYTVIIVVSLLCFFIVDITPSNSANQISTLKISKLKDMIHENKRGFFMVVMAAWCGPCIRELPDLVYLYKKYQKQGFKIVAICVDYNGPRAMQPIIDKYRVTFPVYWVGEKAIDELSIFKIPMLMVVKHGKIAERIIGKKSRIFLENQVLEFLKNGKNKPSSP